MHSFALVVVAFLLMASGALAVFSFNEPTEDEALPEAKDSSPALSLGPIAIKSTPVDANGNANTVDGTVTKMFSPRNHGSDYWPQLEQILNSEGGYFRDDELCAKHCAVKCVNRMLIVNVFVDDKKDETEQVYIGFAKCNSLLDGPFLLGNKFLIAIGVAGLLGIAMGFFGAIVVFRRVKAAFKIGTEGKPKKAAAFQETMENI